MHKYVYDAACHGITVAPKSTSKKANIDRKLSAGALNAVTEKDRGNRKPPFDRAGGTPDL